MKTQAIEVTNLAKSFELSKGKTVQILNGLSLSANYGEFISILGVSGSGKSTLLKTLSRMISPISGKVYLEGTELKYLKNKDIERYSSLCESLGLRK